MIIQRKSESTVSPKIVEYLQGGILIRFNIQEITRDDELFFLYDEFWFEKNATITEIGTKVKASGFSLTKRYKDLIV